MRTLYLILEGIFALSLLISASSSASAVDPTNATVTKTPANATVFTENDTSISQPRTPLVVTPENITTGNMTDTNITGR